MILGKKLWPLFLILLPIFIFFKPFWLEGKNIIPSDTLTGLYHPFRDVVRESYPNGTPFKNYLITDAVRQQYVYRQFSIEQLKNGEIPWWNPYVFSGTPHLAGMQSATFYPLNILYWIFDFTFVWNIQIVLQLVIGSLSMYAYLKYALRLHDLSSIYGAIVWSFSGFIISWLVWNLMVHIVILTPIVLLAIDRYVHSKKVVSVWLAVLIITMLSQFYAGYPQVWLFMFLLEFSYALWKIVQRYREKASFLIPKISILFISFLVFIIGISPLFIATFEFANVSNRVIDQGDLSTKQDWFIPVVQLLQLGIPDFFGNPATLNYWGVFNYGEFVSYTGVIGLFFVSVAVLSYSKKQHQDMLFFVVVLVASLLFGLKNPLSEWIFTLGIPMISSSQPSRILSLIGISLAVLSAIGIDQFLQYKAKLRGSALLLALLFTIVWGTLLLSDHLSFQGLHENRTVAMRNTILPTLEFIGLMIVLLSTAVFKKDSIRTQAVLVMIVVTSIFGIRFAQKYTPFTDPSFLYPESEILTYLQKNAGVYRYMTIDRSIIAPNINMAYDLFTIEGYDPLYLQDYGRLLSTSDDFVYPDTSNKFNRILAREDYDSKMIDLLGVKYILSLRELENTDNIRLVMQEGATYLYENTNVYPRAFIIDSLDNFGETNYTAATVVSYEPKSVTISVSTENPAYLILTDAYYSDWVALVDGTSVEVINWFGMRATMIPEGEHEVIYDYRHSYL